jgi:hypothetical protein
MKPIDNNLSLTAQRSNLRIGYRLLFLFAALLLLSFIMQPLALTVPWHTVDSGGGRTAGGGGTAGGDCASAGQFSLCGTAGQPDAAVLASSPFQLSGGFWAGRRLSRYTVHLPLVSKQP